MAGPRSELNVNGASFFAQAAVDEPKGFAASASRTIGAEVDRVFAAWADPRKRRQWLRNDELVVTETNPSISLHGTWASSTLRVFFMPRGPSRTHVAVDQEALPTGRKAEHMKKFWQARLGRLAAALEHPRP
jgi:uncharacterized protein YndB with AHSA1/START domain